VVRQQWRENRFGWHGCFHEGRVSVAVCAAGCKYPRCSESLSLLSTIHVSQKGALWAEKCTSKRSISPGMQWDWRWAWHCTYISGTGALPSTMWQLWSIYHTALITKCLERTIHEQRASRCTSDKSTEAVSRTFPKALRMLTKMFHCPWRNVKLLISVCYTNSGNFVKLVVL
jgi:hypothetical protein